MVEVTEQATKGCISQIVQLADERMLYGSILIGVAAHFLGLAVGVLLYFLLFVGLTMRKKASFSMLIQFAAISGVTLLVTMQFQYRAIPYILLHLWATISILFAIRYLTDLKAASYFGSIIARVMKLDRLNGHVAAWLTAGIAVGYGTVQLYYEATTTDWGALTIIAVTLLLPLQSRKTALFLYTGVSSYALLTTLLLWKGILIIGSDPLFFVQSYLPDLVLPVVLALCYSALSSKKVETASGQSIRVEAAEPIG